LSLDISLIEKESKEKLAFDDDIKLRIESQENQQTTAQSNKRKTSNVITYQADSKKNNINPIDDIADTSNNINNSEVLNTIDYFITENDGSVSLQYKLKEKKSHNDY